MSNSCKIIFTSVFLTKKNVPENAILATERAPLKKTIFLRKNSLYYSVFKKKSSAKSQIISVILQQKTHFFHKLERYTCPFLKRK